MSLIDVNRTLNQIATQTAKVQFEQSQDTRGTGEIDQQGFLQLLMAQLQSQDPLEPMDNAEFVSQQAAFAQVEKLDALTNSLDTANSIAQASSLVGKNVEFQSGINYDTGAAIISSGRIDSVIVDGGDASIVVNDQTYSIDSINKINADQL